MKLKNASKHFDRTTAKDAYNHAVTFKCQLEPLDLYRMDGARVKLRGLSTAPGVAVPTRRVITIANQPYLVSDMSADEWEGETVRQRFVIQGADSIVQIKTIAQELAGTAGTQAYASVEFAKYATDERDNSDFNAQYHIFVSPYEVVRENYIISTATEHFLVKHSNETTGGLRDAHCNLLDSPVIDSASYSSRTYDPITDSYTGTASTVRCVRVRWQDHFTYLSQGSTKFERADVVVFVPMSMTPKSSDQITLSDGAWTVLSVVTHADYRSLHLRRA